MKRKYQILMERKSDNKRMFLYDVFTNRKKAKQFCDNMMNIQPSIVLTVIEK